MAMSATIAVNPSTVVTGTPVNAVLTISNSGGSVVRMTSIVPFTVFTGGLAPVINSNCNIGQVNFGPNANLAVPAGGTLIVTWQVTFNGPSTGYISSGSNTFDVDCTCYSDDGSVFSPAAATVIVNYAVTFASSQQ